MSKAKFITGAGIIAAGTVFSGLDTPTENPRHSSVQKDAHLLETTADSLASADIVVAVKREPTKVYHRFEEIPEINDTEAPLYAPEEYTYIINADTYQKTGQIELKRVLVAELTKANALSIIYRSECATRIPSQNDDQITKYDVDLKLLNPTGKYKGPSQMNDEGVLLFARYLAANPKTRQYVLPILKTSNGTVEEAAAELGKKFFTPDGTPRPMDERDAVLCGMTFQKLKIKENAWRTLASPKLKSFIAKEERKRLLSNTTKNYFCLTELFPSEESLKQSLEDFNLAFFPLGRTGKPKFVMAALARSLNLKGPDGNLDATRIPTFAIAASLSHINWKGNGKQALSDAQQIRAEIQKNPAKKAQILKDKTKTWVTGKGRQYGIDELSKLNIITPDLIRQYCEIELPGAKNLEQEYNRQVKLAEEKLAASQITKQPQEQTAPDTAAQKSLSNKGKTLVLSAVDFIRGR